MGDPIEPTTGGQDPIVWIVPQGMTTDQAIQFILINKDNLPQNSRGNLLVPTEVLIKTVDEKSTWLKVVKELILRGEKVD